MSAGLGNINYSGNYVQNLGGAPAMLEGTIAARPAFSLTGAIYWATDTHIVYRFNGLTWDSFSGGAAATPTWQQTLSVAGGSVLTGSNNINVGSVNDLFFTNAGRIQLLTATGDELLLRSGTTSLNASSALDIQCGTNMALTVGNTRVDTITAGDYDLFVNDGAFVFTGNFGGSSFSFDRLGSIEISSGSLMPITITSAGVMEAVSSGAGATFGANSGTTSLFNTNGFVNISSSNNMTFSTTAGDAIVNSSGSVALNAAAGTIQLTASGIVLLDGASVNASSVINAAGGVFFPAGEVIQYQNTGAAPGTNIGALPTTVYGGLSTLMGAPAGFISCIVAGNPQVIPFY
jgi:hypothetical protein